MENRTVVSRLIPWPSLVSKGTRTGNQWGLRKKKKRNRKKGSVSALRTLNFRGESRRRPTVIPEGYAILLAPFAVSFYPLTVAFFLSNNPRVLSFRRCAAAAAAMFRFYLVCSIYRLIFFFFSALEASRFTEQPKCFCGICHLPGSTASWCPFQFSSGTAWRQKPRCIVTRPLRTNWWSEL